MTCFKCGASNPVVHLNMMIDGAVENRAYCRTCLRESPELQAVLEKKRQQRKVWLDQKMDELARKDLRFTREAFDFILNWWQYARKRDATLPYHVTARQLVEACVAQAKETYGPSARVQLRSWGIGSSSDVGDIVFLLIESGFMGKRDEDKRKDFDGLPFLENDPA